MKHSTYNASNIEVHEGLEHVRVRPDMYIGNTESKGLHHLIWEIIDNSMDEILNGFGDNVKVKLFKDGSVSIRDNGRGIPVDIHEQKGIPAVRLTFEVLGAGGKFGNDSYKKSGGLHGVGASVVNALSTKVDIKIWKDGYRYTLSYKNSKLEKDLKKGGKTRETGTEIRFWPDKKIFADNKFSAGIIKDKLKQLSYLNSGAKLEFEDENTGEVQEYLAKKGLVEYITYLLEANETIGKPFSFSSEVKDTKIEVAMQYSQGYDTNILSFVNNVPTNVGGRHVEGLKTALTRAINEIIKRKNQEKKRGKKDIQLQGGDTLEGLTIILSVNMADPHFGGQTKDELTNPEIKGIVMSAAYDGILQSFIDDEKTAKAVISKITQNYDNRVKIREVKEAKLKSNNSAFASLMSSEKYAACSSKDPEKTELFIVEGDSAGGSAKQGRNRVFQAILPLKGKPLNVEKKSFADIISNDELNGLVSEVGGEIENGKIVVKKSNFSKIIIMTDADKDGWHIQLILITFFYRVMPELIREGRVYIAIPPLYKIYDNSKFEYAYTEEELEKLKKKFKKNYEIQRYKGLGEMDYKQLWETTMNPETRTLIKLEIDDAAKIDRDISLFMGPKVEPRREFLMSNM